MVAINIGPMIIPGKTGCPSPCRSRAFRMVSSRSSSSADRMQGSVVLKAEDVAVRYGGVEALHPISLSIEPGGLLLVLGPNGAGKTSLLRALAGAVPMLSGRVVLAGQDVTRLPAYRRSRQGMALVPEGRGRLPGLTVEENLEL